MNNKNTHDYHDSRFDFASIANHWWDENGPMKPLHQMREARILSIIECAKIIHGKDSNQPLSNLKILDLGAGAGLTSEPLARLGAKVTAVEQEEELISIAKKRSHDFELAIDYQCHNIFDFQSKEKFDIILLLEVIEHEPDQKALTQKAASFLKPNGILLLSTINRSFLSWLTGIVLAEEVFKWLPRGTHDWNFFVTPSELGALLKDVNLKPCFFRSLDYLPAKGWHITKRKHPINYFIAGQYCP